MHAVIIAAIRLRYPEMANNADAENIAALSEQQIDAVKEIIIDRLNIIKPSAKADAEIEIDTFIDNWKFLASREKRLRYYVWKTDKYNRLMNTYGESCTDTEKPTLRSMREVESAANMYYFTED